MDDIGNIWYDINTNAGNYSNSKKEEGIVIKKVVAVVLVFAFLLCDFSMVNMKADAKTTQAVGIVEKRNDYEVAFKISSEWDGHFNGEITIRNTGKEVIHNWSLYFNSDFKIENIWNAQIIYSDGDCYFIDNNDWNQDIEKGASQSFGFTASYEDRIAKPSNFQIVNFVSDVQEDRYEISYKENSDWNSGFTGEITIKNIGEETIEDWELFFDFDRDITWYWSADLVKKKEGQYHIRNKGFNSNIKSGESLTIGVMGDGGKKGDTIKNTFMRHISFQDFKQADTDGDGLSNLTELEIGSDYEKADTDEDGLPDAYEYCELETSPVLADTDHDGIADGDEDFDGDKLSNLQEYKFGTDPFEKDTDGDGLNDFEEINSYKTDPLEEDTDGDTLKDGDEVAMGFSPLLKDTDGNGVKDPDEKMYQTLTENMDDPSEQLKDVSVSLKTNGYIGNEVMIENIYNVDLLSTDVEGLIGVPIELTSKVDFDEAKVKFYYDENKLKETKEEDLGVLWYDEASQWYELQEKVEIDTENNIVTLTTTHFSKYMLVDRKIWFETWSKEIDYRGKCAYFDFMYAVDTSKSMDIDDRLKTAKKALSSFVSEQASKDRGGLVSFGGTTKLISQLDTSKTELQKKIKELAIADENGTDIENGLKKSISALKDGKNANKVIILISDGQLKYEEEVAERAVKKGIHIYTVNVGSAKYSESLKKYANVTGGEYYHCPTTADIEVVFAKIQNVSLDKIDTTDSDKDGVYDIFEKNGVRLPNGKLIKTSTSKADTDKDGLTDGEEYGFDYSSALGQMKYLNKTIQIGKVKKVRYFLLRSNPKVKDTDHDGLSDKYDPYPWHGYCGGREPGKATNHRKLTLKDTYYVCDKCGYKFERPEMQDKNILSVEDKQSMFCLAAMFSYYAALRTEKGYENLCRNEKLLLNKMMKIRKKDQYKNKYAYSDKNGVCKGERYKVQGAVYITHSKVTLGSLGWYDGFYSVLAGMGISQCCKPLGHLWDIIVAGTEWEGYENMDKAGFGVKKTIGLCADYIERNAKAKPQKYLAIGILKTIDAINIVSALKNTTVCVGDDIIHVCIQRGVKNPMKESEIKQSIAEFVMNGTNEPSYIQLGSEYGHEDYLK